MVWNQLRVLCHDMRGWQANDPLAIRVSDLSQLRIPEEGIHASGHSDLRTGPHCTIQNKKYIIHDPTYQNVGICALASIEKKHRIVYPLVHKASHNVGYM